MEVGDLDQVVLSLHPPRIGLNYDSMVPNGVAALGVDAVEAGLTPFAFQSDGASALARAKHPPYSGVT